MQNTNSVRTSTHNPTAVRIAKVARIIFLGLLAYAPLHIFLSTVTGANLGGLAFFKIAKDIVALFGFCLILSISFPQAWFKKFVFSPLAILIALYVGHTLLLSLFRDTDLDAEVLAITYNLRFLVFFTFGWLLNYWFPATDLLRTAVKTVLWSAAAVVGFGLLQYWILPNNALTHLGFTKANGVFPAFFIDDKPNLERVMSTVRDPNSLGSYLIIISTLLGSLLLTVRKQKRLFFGGALLATVLCLLLTFSRSALLGLAVSALVLLTLLGRQKITLPKQTLRRAILVGVMGGILLVGGLFVARDSYFVQNVIFHADESTVQEDPNQLRLRFYKESLDTIAESPSGLGPGTAGLASIKNNVQGTKLNENYYFQIATEVGVVGLGLFLAIVGLVGWQLYRAARSNLYALALFASLIGLCLTNFLVHIWSNEAVAYTWWGLAGLAYVGAMVKQSAPIKIKPKK